MKNIALTLSALAFSAAIAGSASAQVVATGPVTSLPQGLQTVLAGAGGATAGSIVAFSILGALLVVTVINDDGSTTTTTTAISN